MAKIKFLLGTPVHDKKEYSMYKFLDSVKDYDLPGLYVYIVDNSDTVDFSQRIEDYCEKIKLKDCRVVHLAGMSGLEQEARLAKARDNIRDYMLTGDCTHWLSVESDIILPPRAPRKLLPFLEQFKFINNFYPDRVDPNIELSGLGFTIVARELMEKFDFSQGGGYGQCDDLVPNCYYSNDSWFVVRVRRAGYATVDFHGLVGGIRHLAD